MDDIQQKLILIDRQLTAGKDFHEKLIAACPLLFAAVGLIIGILIQSKLTLHPIVWLIPISLATIITIFTTLLKTQRKPIILAYIALSTFVALGAVRLINFNHAKPNDIRNLVTQQRTLATIQGTILTESRIHNDSQWQFAKFQPTDPPTSFYLTIKKIETPNGWAETSGTVRVQVSGPVLDLKSGNRIEAYCWLSRFNPPTNPGQFDTEKYLARKNIFIAASINSRNAITLIDPAKTGTWQKIKTKLRKSATNTLIEDLQPHEQTIGLMQGLLLGFRANIDPQTYQAFQKTGLLHFISLSGMHLGILITAIWMICRIAGLMKRSRAAICIIAIIIFMMIVPPRAPTVRAAIIGLTFCVSFFFNRKPRPLNTLALAAIIQLLIRPTVIFEAGFQLSFTCIAGILLFVLPINHAITDKLITWLKLKRTKKTSLIFHTLNLLATGIAAWLGGAGIMLYHFKTITPLSPLWTVLTFPIIVTVLIAGYLKMTLAFFLPTLASLAGIIAQSASALLISVVKIFASCEISYIAIGQVSVILILCYYSVLLFAVMPYLRKTMVKKMIYTLSFTAIIIFLIATNFNRNHRKNLILTTLDVGHGQAILLQLPGSSNILFDAGSLHRTNIGNRIVNPFLDYKGIKKIDHLLISHNDSDHINGIPEIAQHCKISNVYANNSFLSGSDKWGTSAFLKNIFKEKDLNISVPQKQLIAKKNTCVKILWPDQENTKINDLKDNDTSFVTLIQFHNKKILLCSDIEKFAQNELLKIHPNLNADIVIVPHHGSVITLDPEFLKKLNPQYLIYSCSQKIYEQYENLPSEETPIAFYTPRDGAIKVTIDPAGKINIETFKKNSPYKVKAIFKIIF